MIALEMILKLRDGFTKSMDKAEGKFKKSVKNIKASWNSLVTLPNIAATAAPVIITKKLVDASMEMEALQSKMTAALPAFGAAGREINFITEESDRLGLNLRKTATEYATFIAATTRSGLSVKETRQIFSDMSEALVSLKLPASRVGLVFQALTQMSSKGVVSMEELRRQLSDSLPASIEIGARAMEMITRAFNEVVSKGGLMSRDFLPAFAKQVKKELGGSFDLAREQMQASLNLMQNELFKFSSNAGNLMKGDIKDGIDTLTGAIKKLNENSQILKAIYDSLRMPFIVVANEVQILFDSFMMLERSAGTIVTMAVTPLIESFLLLSETLHMVAGKVVAIFHGDFEKALSFGDVLNNIKTRFKVFLETEKNLLKQQDEEWKKYLENYDKNTTQMADAMARAITSIQRAGVKKTKGSTAAIESGTGTTTGDEGESEEERKKRLRQARKIHEQYQKFIEELRKDDVANAKAIFEYKQELLRLEKESQDFYESARINSIENYAQREMELLDNKYRLEREKYKENKNALVNIEKAYNLEVIALDKQIKQYQQDATKSWVDTVTNSLMTIAGENKKFTVLYRTAAIIQIIADTYVAATSAYKSMVQAYGAFGIPAGVAAAAIVTAAGLANVAAVSGATFGQGTRSFRTNGPQYIMVGDNPGGRERVTVTPESSQNINGPRVSSTGNLTLHIHDSSGAITETFRRKIREGGGMDSVIRDIFGRASALGVV